MVFQISIMNILMSDVFISILDLDTHSIQYHSTLESPTSPSASTHSDTTSEIPTSPTNSTYSADTLSSIHAPQQQPVDQLSDEDSVSNSSDISDSDSESDSYVYSGQLPYHIEYTPRRDDNDNVYDQDFRENSFLPDESWGTTSITEFWLALYRNTYIEAYVNESRSNIDSVINNLRNFEATEQWN